MWSVTRANLFHRGSVEADDIYHLALHRKRLPPHSPFLNLILRICASVSSSEKDKMIVPPPWPMCRLNMIVKELLTISIHSRYQINGNIWPHDFSQVSKMSSLFPHLCNVDSTGLRAVFKTPWDNLQATLIVWVYLALPLQVENQHKESWNDLLKFLK